MGQTRGFFTRGGKKHPITERKHILAGNSRGENEARRALLRKRAYSYREVGKMTTPQLKKERSRLLNIVKQEQSRGRMKSPNYYSLLRVRSELMERDAQLERMGDKLLSLADSISDEEENERLKRKNKLF